MTRGKLWWPKGRKRPKEYGRNRVGRILCGGVGRKPKWRSKYAEDIPGRYGCRIRKGAP